MTKQSLKLTFTHIHGPDVLTFLQGQVTADLRQLNDNERVFTCACNRQGRMVATFYCWRENENSYWLLLPDNLRDKLITFLKPFIFRAKVDIDTSAASPYVYDSTPLQDIKNKIAWLTPDSSEKYLPQHVEIENHSGLSFKKGCFLGQEIIGRYQHLAKKKKELVLGECDIAEAGSIDNLVFGVEDGGRFVYLCIV